MLVVIDGAESLGEDLSDLVRDFPASTEGPWIIVTSRLLPPQLDLPVVRLQPLDVDGHGGRDAEPDAITLFHDRHLASGGAPSWPAAPQFDLTASTASRLLTIARPVGVAEAARKQLVREPAGKTHTKRCAA